MGKKEFLQLRLMLSFYLEYFFYFPFSLRSEILIFFLFPLIVRIIHFRTHFCSVLAI